MKIIVYLFRLNSNLDTKQKRVFQLDRIRIGDDNSPFTYRIGGDGNGEGGNDGRGTYIVIRLI